MQKPVTFLVVDDHPVFRQGLVALIRSNERYQVCAEAGTAAESLAALEHARAGHRPRGHLARRPERPGPGEDAEGGPPRDARAHHLDARRGGLRRAGAEGRGAGLRDEAGGRLRHAGRHRDGALGEDLRLRGHARPAPGDDVQRGARRPRRRRWSG